MIAGFATGPDVGSVAEHASPKHAAVTASIRVETPLDLPRAFKNPTARDLHRYTDTSAAHTLRCARQKEPTISSYAPSFTESTPLALLLSESCWTSGEDWTS